MIALDEDALECDLAEYYHIYDMRSLPANKVATFSVGLRENSRIKLKLAGNKYPLDTLLIAAAVDRLSTLIWMQTKDGRKGVNRPESLLAKLVEKKEEKDKEIVSFDNPEDFEAAMQRINQRIKEG